MTKKPNFYGTAKSILSEGITVHGWWKKEFNFNELKKAFGVKALARGVNAALNLGEIVPDEVQDLVKEAL